MVIPSWDTLGPGKSPPPTHTEWEDHMLEAIRRLRPRRATGFYVTNAGIIWGYRIVREKFPNNFVPFEERKDG